MDVATGRRDTIVFALPSIACLQKDDDEYCKKMINGSPKHLCSVLLFFSYFQVQERNHFEQKFEAPEKLNLHTLMRKRVFIYSIVLYCELRIQVCGLIL